MHPSLAVLSPQVHNATSALARVFSRLSNTSWCRFAISNVARNACVWVCPRAPMDVVTRRWEGEIRAIAQPEMARISPSKASTHTSHAGMCIHKRAHARTRAHTRTHAHTRAHTRTHARAHMREVTSAHARAGALHSRDLCSRLEQGSNIVRQALSQCTESACALHCHFCNPAKARAH
eukprot:5704783-Pleurochrysis_carterae.AAC.1